MFSTFRGRLERLNLDMVAIFIILIAVIITLWHVGSSPAYLSHEGAATRQSSYSLSSIYHNPLNTPHNLLLYVSDKLGDGLGILRLASYAAALVFAVCFYRLSKGLFGRFVGYLAAIIFCLSPFFIISARQVSPEIMLFWPIALMAAYAWFKRTPKKPAAWLILTALAGLSLYTPGLLPWLIVAAIIARKQLLDLIRELPRPIIGAGAAIFLILLIPAGVFIVHDWRQVQSFTPLPRHWPSPLEILKNFGWMLSAIFARTPYAQPLLVGRLPLLDVIQAALLVFGACALWTAARLKLYVYAASIGLAALLAAINNNLTLLFLGLPTAGLMMAAGLRFLYIEWRGVFPRNPLAKYLALVLMSILVAVQLVYGLRYSLLAWPDSAATRHSYVLK